MALVGARGDDAARRDVFAAIAALAREQAPALAAARRASTPTARPQCRTVDGALVLLRRAHCRSSWRDLSDRMDR